MSPTHYNCKKSCFAVYTICVLLCLFTCFQAKHNKMRGDSGLLHIIYDDSLGGGIQSIQEMTGVVESLQPTMQSSCVFIDIAHSSQRQMTSISRSCCKPPSSHSEATLHKCKQCYMNYERLSTWRHKKECKVSQQANSLLLITNKQTNKRDLLQQAHCANLINIKKHHCSRSLDFICSSRHYNKKRHNKEAPSSRNNIDLT